jgi:colicin import membrane protein
MKVVETPQQHEHSVREPLKVYLAVSVAVHGLAIFVMIGGAWLWGKPQYYKPPSYSVSLVDAPLSIRQSDQNGGEGKPSEKRPEDNQQQPPAAPELPPAPPLPVKRQEATVVEPEVVEAPPKVAPPKPEPKKVEPPKPEPKTVAEPPKKQPEAPPVSKTVTEAPRKPAEKRPEPKEVKPSPTRTLSPPKPATATEVQQAIAKLREQQTRDEKAQSQARQAQQQAAEQRLAALRERFSAGGGGAAGAGTGAGSGAGGVSDMQRIRLQLYQERIRLQIIEAWILPMPQEEARKLQATALLTVSRDGDVTYLKLLQPSGNALFDESLIRAIKQATPLPPLPEDYQGAFLEVEMRFRPHES